MLLFFFSFDFLPIIIYFLRCYAIFSFFVLPVLVSFSFLMYIFSFFKYNNYVQWIFDEIFSETYNKINNFCLVGFKCRYCHYKFVSTLSLSLSFSCIVLYLPGFYHSFIKSYLAEKFQLT